LRPDRLAQQVPLGARCPSGFVPVRQGSPLLERPDSQLLERPDSLLQERPADSQLEELRAEMFVVAREIALAKSAQMRVRLGRQ
jgi:hypothetical protein